VDRFLGDLYEKLHDEHPDGYFFVLSDHGFCGTKWEVNLNAILRREGFLSLPPSASSLESIDESTKAFALDPARIYLNTRKRFGRGGVDEVDVVPLLADLKALFEELTHQGQPVVRAIFSRHEAYSGPMEGEGPDLLLVPTKGFDLKGKLGMDEEFRGPRLQGMHT